MSDVMLWIQAGIAVAFVLVGIYGITTANLIDKHFTHPERCPCNEHNPRKLVQVGKEDTE